MASSRGGRKGRIRDIIKQTQAQPGREAGHRSTTSSTSKRAASRRGMMIGTCRARLGASGRRVRHCRRVDDVGLRCATSFSPRGADGRASSRCMLLYAYVFGVSLMIYEKFDRDVVRLRRGIADLIARSPSRVVA